MAEGIQMQVSVFPSCGSLHRGVALGEGSVLAGDDVVTGSGLDTHPGGFPELESEALAHL